ncbi:MAG: hypothetical protein JNK36_00300 [Bacteroidia bacterium]|nr:hypothetical protein [Bacteroidia bacterium]MBP7713486.1 hypothetical protein [Bacteroidia bacterium]MBP8667328.1 hypothetical protein [Bacteroidia bacterium]QQR96451.1 MAG: hypothetical protein IPJ93_07595 [Bacteroidota bacterium]HQZ78769.1 hypothetical protein [Bacteroidia bacterium]
MENSKQELTINFDKTNLKDLLIHQIATHLQKNWSDNEVIDLFLESQFNFVEARKTKGEIVSELITTHKTALEEEQYFTNITII